MINEKDGDNDTNTNENNVENAKYEGEETFMNNIHPFEYSKNRDSYKTSPMQKAMIECINMHGGYATEEEILNFVKDRWDVIQKYTERGFLSPPSIRVIRLNCAVKKKARHLFLENPSIPHSWSINSIPRKSRDKKIKVNKGDNIKDNYQRERKINKICDDDEKILKEKPFQNIIRDFICRHKFPVHYDQIKNYAKNYSSNTGLFQNLQFENRLRATLISLKSSLEINHNPQNNYWFHSLTAFQSLSYC